MIRGRQRDIRVGGDHRHKLISVHGVASARNFDVSYVYDSSTILPELVQIGILRHHRNVHHHSRHHLVKKNRIQVSNTKKSLFKPFYSSSVCDFISEELRKIRVLIQQNRTETAKRRLKALILHHSISQLFNAFSHSSPPPNKKPTFIDTLLIVYVEARLPNKAVELCSLVRSDGNFISLSAFNVFLESLVNANQFDKTLKIFYEAVDYSVRVNKFSYGKVIQSVVKLGDLEKGFELLNGMKKCGIMANGFVYNVLIDRLCKERRVGDAQKLFDELSNRNVAPNRVTYNSPIDGC
ncbi:hypothetical protein C2S52_005264 [Perilla frutescens var. hirtella]|nr:hypothetical protein C2S52_005264 [Perilla frutescens var. hirtella]